MRDASVASFDLTQSRPRPHVAVKSLCCANCRAVRTWRTRDGHSVRRQMREEVDAESAESHGVRGFHGQRRTSVLRRTSHFSGCVGLACVWPVSAGTCARRASWAGSVRQSVHHAGCAGGFRALPQLLVGWSDRRCGGASRSPVGAGRLAPPPRAARGVSNIRSFAVASAIERSDKVARPIRIEHPYPAI